ncbi:MAG: hypothetical protein QG655_437 [Actinomycetota bacterium]|jgi:hypothetical protein|nr:hypothetical protein [Actinomycetota bacterium]HPY25654.1 hypothetical protein [Mycobacterium sp.]
MARAAAASDMAIDIDAIAWQFLGSHYTRREYWDWPLEQRIVAYLRHIGHAELLRNGAAYTTLIERVMDNIARARRDGLLDEIGEGHDG